VQRGALQRTYLSEDDDLHLVEGNGVVRPEHAVLGREDHARVPRGLDKALEGLEVGLIHLASAWERERANERTSERVNGRVRLTLRARAHAELRTSSLSAPFQLESMSRSAKAGTDPVFSHAMTACLARARLRFAFARMATAFAGSAGPTVVFCFLFPLFPLFPFPPESVVPWSLGAALAGFVDVKKASRRFCVMAQAIEEIGPGFKTGNRGQVVLARTSGPIHASNRIEVSYSSSYSYSMALYHAAVIVCLAVVATNVTGHKKSRTSASLASHSASIIASSSPRALDLAT